MKLINFNFNKSDKIIFLSIFFISLSIFIFYVNLNADENYWDELEYLNISKQILEDGTFDKHASYRTYLYPTIIASIKLFYNDDIVTKIILSGIQYAVYLGTVIFIANYARTFPKLKPKSAILDFIDPKKGAQHYIDRYNKEPTYKSWFDKNYPDYSIKQATQIAIAVLKSKNKIIWHSVIAFGLLNPFLIQQTTLFSSDIFATCFVVLAIFCLTRLDLTKSKFILLAIGLFYSSVMIRPSAWIFLPIVVGLILFRFLKKKHINIYKVSLISLILLVIFIPQIYQNVTKFGEWTPIVVYPLYEQQINRSHEYLKLSGLVPDLANQVDGASLRYYSPFPVNDKVENIYQLLLEDPSTFLVVYSSHIFGILDWNYVDNYIKDFYPLNRIPTSLLIYSTWFFVIWGVIETRFFFTANGFLLNTLIISAILFLAFIATTSVEIRYGFPIFLLLLPFSGYGVKYLYDSCIKHDNKTSKLWKNRIGFSTIYLLFILIFFYVSFLFSTLTDWVDWFEFFNL